MNSTVTWRSTVLAGVAFAAMAPGLSFGEAAPQPAPVAAPPASEVKAAPYATSAVINRAIGYVVYSRQLAVNVVSDPVGLKADCPEGLNDGPRQQFAKMFPDPAKRSVMDVLKLEADNWFPKADFVGPGTYKEPLGTIAVGMNLDGKVDPNDYTSPTGEPGIDNQMYRSVGCINFFRKPDGVNYYASLLKLGQDNFNRILLEFTEVDDLRNDPDVTLTFYQGLDPLIRNAKGDPAPRGSNQISDRWGKGYVQSIKGSIVNGVFTSAGKFDLRLPETAGHGEFTDEFIRSAQFKVTLDSEKATGLLAGYADVDHYYFKINRNWPTNRTSYGDLAQQQWYASMVRNADGLPDANGRFTGISAAWEIDMVQTYLVRPGPEPRRNVLAQK